MHRFATIRHDLRGFLEICSSLFRFGHNLPGSVRTTEYISTGTASGWKTPPGKKRAASFASPYARRASTTDISSRDVAGSAGGPEVPGVVWCAAECDRVDMVYARRDTGTSRAGDSAPIPVALKYDASKFLPRTRQIDRVRFLLHEVKSTTTRIAIASSPSFVTAYRSSLSNGRGRRDRRDISIP